MMAQITRNESSKWLGKIKNNQKTKTNQTEGQIKGTLHFSFYDSRRVQSINQSILLSTGSHQKIALAHISTSLGSETMHNYSTQEEEERSSQLDSTLHFTHSQSKITDMHESTYGMLSLNEYSHSQNEGEMEYPSGSQIYQNEVLKQLNSSRMSIQQDRHFERSYSSSSEDQKEALVDDSNDINYFSSPKNFSGFQDDREYDQNYQDYYQQSQEYSNKILQPLILRQFSDNPYSNNIQRGSFLEFQEQGDNIQLFQQNDVLPELLKCYSNEISSCYIPQALDSGKKHISVKSSFDQREIISTEISLQINKEHVMNNNQSFQKYSQNTSESSVLSSNFKETQSQIVINCQNRKQDNIIHGDLPEIPFSGASQFQANLQKHNMEFKQSFIRNDKNQLSLEVINQPNPEENLTYNKVSQSTSEASAIHQEMKQSISYLQLEESEPRSASTSTSSSIVTVNLKNVSSPFPNESCCPQSENSETPNKLAKKVGEINKKNIVRNIIRAFKRYFLNKRAKPLTPLVFFPNERIDECRSKFKSFFKDKKFNNSILKRLITDKLYGRIFEYFLQNQSDNYIAVSNVKAKDSHKIFVDYLLVCFQDSLLLDNIETYTKSL